MTNCKLCNKNPQTLDDCPLCISQCPRFGPGKTPAQSSAITIADELNGTSHPLDKFIENPTLEFCTELDSIVLQCEVCGYWGDANGDVKNTNDELICNDCERL